jgi:hypothetical protein
MNVQTDTGNMIQGGWRLADCLDESIEVAFKVMKVPGILESRASLPSRPTCGISLSREGARQIPSGPHLPWSYSMLNKTRGFPFPRGTGWTRHLPSPTSGALRTYALMRTEQEHERHYTEV